MKHVFIFILFWGGIICGNAQNFRGQIFLTDRPSDYLNLIYVTNLQSGRSVISDFMGKFSIPAKLGDNIRFTSVLTERMDIEMKQQQLDTPHFLIHLQSSFVDIQEVVLQSFKPTGQFAKDFYKIKINNEKLIALKNAIGLPSSQEYEPELPKVVNFHEGLALDVNAIYDLISGDYKKKKRLFEYEKMMRNIAKINKFYGENYFKNIKIPIKLIDNFLQFVYLSDNLETWVERNNYAAVGVSIQKYIPIYIKRVQNSNLLEIVGQK